MATCSIFILQTQTCWPTIQAEHVVESAWQQCLNQQLYAQTVTRNVNSLAAMLQKLHHLLTVVYTAQHTQKMHCCVSVTTTVMQTCHNVKLYVHCHLFSLR
jgi:hypothetical protein